MINFGSERNRMVDEQIAGRGVKDERVLAALRKVPRHEFLPEAIRGVAYSDSALPIGEGQTMSQPYMVALMTELLELRGTERTLEIGTGSGYQAAVLAELCEKVFTVERIKLIAERARTTLDRLGYKNVAIKIMMGRTAGRRCRPSTRSSLRQGPRKSPLRLLNNSRMAGGWLSPWANAILSSL